MTRVAVVAESEDVRAALAEALGASPAFEVVDAGATVADVAGDAELLVVARERRGGSRCVDTHRSRYRGGQDGASVALRYRRSFIGD